MPQRYGIGDGILSHELPLRDPHPSGHSVVATGHTQADLEPDDPVHVASNELVAGSYESGQFGSYQAFLPPTPSHQVIRSPQLSRERVQMQPEHTVLPNTELPSHASHGSQASSSGHKNPRQRIHDEVSAKKEKYRQTHPDHSSIRRRVQPSPATIPNGREREIWKQPYSYGYFGASGERHWAMQHGYRDRYTQWSRR